MGLTLKTIGKRNNRATVMLRGESVEVRGVSAAERDKIASMYLDPLPPIGRDPRLGDGAPSDQPNTADPGYRRELMIARARRVLIRFAVATDYVTAEGHRWDAAAEHGLNKRWWAAVESELATIDPPLSDAEIDTVLEAAGKCESGAGDPRKNSSSTSAGAGVETDQSSTPSPGPTSSP